MITKVEPASNSTQLTQLALDQILRELSVASRLPMARLQKSINNEKSPIRDMYASLLAYNKAEKLCKEHLDRLTFHKAALKERKKQVQKLLLKNSDPTSEEAFREEFQTNLSLEKEIEDLEYKLTRIHNKCRTLNKVRMQRVQRYIHEYALSRISLKQALTEKGYTQFSETELDNAFANLCEIQVAGASHE